MALQMEILGRNDKNYRMKNSKLDAHLHIIKGRKRAEFHKNPTIGAGGVARTHDLGQTNVHIDESTLGRGPFLQPLYTPLCSVSGD